MTQPLSLKNLPGLLLLLAGGLFFTTCTGGDPLTDEEGVSQSRWDSLSALHRANELALAHLAQAQTQSYVLNALPLAEGTEARIFYNSKTGAVYVLVDSLPELDPNEAYVLWSYDSEDRPTRLGAINMARKDWPQPVGRILNPAIFAISREVLPMPEVPSPERIQCAVRLRDTMD